MKYIGIFAIVAAACLLVAPALSASNGDGSLVKKDENAFHGNCSQSRGNCHCNGSYDGNSFGAQNQYGKNNGGCNGGCHRDGCNGDGCNGVGYNGVGCNGVGCNGVGCNGVGCNGVGCNGAGICAQDRARDGTCDGTGHKRDGSCKAVA